MDKKTKIISSIIILTSFLITSTAIAQIDTTEVLFIGNSHTFFNNMPDIFEQLSLSGGKTAYVDQSTIGGYWLEEHFQNQTTLDKIGERVWDYVILQEQSQVPTIDFYRYGSMYPACRSLDSLITLYGGSTALFMTWGWEFGGMQTIDGHSSVDFVDYFHMQDTVTAAYTMIADELSAVLCPVGLAWARAFTIDSTLDLWAPDHYHPTLIGSYLTACVFYAVLFEDSPVGLPYAGGLDPQMALFLQQIAWDEVTDIADSPEPLPNAFALLPNYPNPFNSSTTIEFTLPYDCYIKLQIYDILGRRVATLIDGSRAAGNQTITWNAEGLTSGVYFGRLTAGEFTATAKLQLLR